MPKCNFKKVACNFIEVALQHGCSPVNFLHDFRTPIYNNTSEGLLLNLKVFEKAYVSLLNLTVRNLNKINVFIILIIK